MYNLIDSYEINSRYNELLKDAEQERLVREITSAQPRFPAKMLQNLGDTLISLGQSLKTLSLSL
jgi:hypothetical protein